MRRRNRLLRFSNYIIRVVAVFSMALTLTACQPVRKPAGSGFYLQPEAADSTRPFCVTHQGRAAF